MKSTSKNIIFLDIDGVMNTYNQMWRQRRTTGNVINENWCPVACRNVKLLCEYFNARIVISSTWRIERDLQELRQILKDNNINPGLLVGTTPVLCHHERDDNLCRGDEIKQWLEENDCRSFVIIDDISASDFLEEQQENLIIVDPNAGLAEKEAVIKAGKIFNGDCQ